MPHSHVFVRLCRKDANGFEVFDCACGERKRVRQDLSGEIVIPSRARSSTDDVLFAPQDADASGSYGTVGTVSPNPLLFS